MHAIVVLSLFLLIGVSILYAMPTAISEQIEDIPDYNDHLDTDVRHLTKRFHASPWIHKRNPALCDYRLQLRPLPFTSALCSYGQNKEEDNQQMNLFKYG